MPPEPGPDDLAAAVLRSAVDGYYPDADVAGTVLASAHLLAIVETLRQAKEDVKNDVRRTSRDNASELDAWIAGARRLHGDIATSKSQADVIIALAEKEQALQRELEDAETQRQFLHAEITFNTEVAGFLGKLQLIETTFVQVPNALGRGYLEEALDALESAEDALARMMPAWSEKIVIVGLMKDRAHALRKSVIAQVHEAWSALVKVDSKHISIRRATEVNSVEVNSVQVIGALVKLELLKGKVDNLHQQLDRVLLKHRLDIREGQIPSISVDKEADTLRILDYNNTLSATQMFNDLLSIIRFLQSRLPEQATAMLLQILVPSLINRLISVRLLWSVPASLDQLPAFEGMLQEVKTFESELVANKWTEERRLSEWVENAPRVWLGKRKELDLDSIRTIVAGGFGNVQTVERTETQNMSAADGKAAAAAGLDGADDWNEDWDENWQENDDEPAATETQPEPATKPAPQPVADSTPTPQPSSGDAGDMDDGEDAADWGFDEDLGLDEDEEKEKESSEKESSEKENQPSEENQLSEENKPLEENQPSEKDEAEVDWEAWAEDDTGSSSIKEPKTPVEASAPSNRRPPQPTSKDVTLVETYTVTAIPLSILRSVSQVISEAAELSNNPTYTSSSVASAAKGLRSLPTLILAVYRALAPQHYSRDLSSSMYLYNDCIYLSEQLAEINYPNTKDITQTSAFGKRQYSKEIDAQRTVLMDYLDGAQGFAGCTDYPQSAECDSAISAIIARLLELHLAWSDVLSKSTLYQSVGSLLGTVVSKLINDIEDLSDISEPESVKLAQYCEDIAAKLEPLFLAHDRENSVLAVYCANWLKFRYLQQILESSMRDISFLYSEGCLVDFEKEELIELVKALFADNENRKKCIDGIRSG